MIYPEVEQSIAIMEPGTLCVLMNGILLGMNVEHWAMITMVRTFLQCGWFYITAFALINYGRGRSPILSQSIHCSSGVNALQNCSTTLESAKE